MSASAGDAPIPAETGRTDLDAMLIEHACTRLVHRYAQFVDFGEAGRIAELFTDDGVWEAADGFAMHGRDEIGRVMGGRQGLARRQSRHVITNVLIDVETPERASGVAYLINYRHDSRTGEAEHPAPAALPKFVGEYLLEFVLTDDGWRIHRSRFRMAFLRRSTHRDV